MTINKFTMKTIQTDKNKKRSSKTLRAGDSVFAKTYMSTSQIYLVLTKRITKNYHLAINLDQRTWEKRLLFVTLDPMVIRIYLKT